MRRTSHLPLGGGQSSMPSGCIFPVKSITSDFLIALDASPWGVAYSYRSPSGTNAAFSSKRLTRASEHRTNSATLYVFDGLDGSMPKEAGSAPFAQSGTGGGGWGLNVILKYLASTGAKEMVCSGAPPPGRVAIVRKSRPSSLASSVLSGAPTPLMEASRSPGSWEIGRASCRERV